MTSNFLLPKPRDWNAFEDLVADVFARKYRSYSFQRYGRSGQRQSGIDIAGRCEQGLLGVQCKHHPENNIASSEIDAELVISESFKPELDVFVFATSANRDVTVHSHVMQLANQRLAQGKYTVEIKFWEDICSWLAEYPDLVYKHFAQFFAAGKAEDIAMPGISDASKETVRWPATLEELNLGIEHSIGAVPRAGLHELSVGISTFDDVKFDRIVDLEMQLTDLFSGAGAPTDEFLEASRRLSQLKALISAGSFSHNVTVHIQARLPACLLFGWTFRKVTHFDLKVVEGDKVWCTSGLPTVPSRLVDALPLMRDAKSHELALVINISRDILPGVVRFVDSWEQQPMGILAMSVEGYTIRSAAHALAVSVELSRRIKSFIDVWGVSKIHLFGALPGFVAVLMAHHLNGICPIHVYFLDDDRNTFRVGGILRNSL